MVLALANRKLEKLAIKKNKLLTYKLILKPIYLHIPKKATLTDMRMQIDNINYNIYNNSKFSVFYDFSCQVVW